MSRPAQLFGLDLGQLGQVRARDMALRFAFGAGISVAAGLVTLWLGPAVGGALLAFPAILPATLSLIEKDEGLASAVHDVGGAVLGAVALCAFAVVASVALGAIAVPEALLGGLAAWIVAAIGLYLLRATGVLPLPVKEKRGSG